jgi:hypothetical protein
MEPHLLDQSQALGWRAGEDLAEERRGLVDLLEGPSNCSPASREARSTAGPKSSFLIRSDIFKALPGRSRHRAGRGLNRVHQPPAPVADAVPLVREADQGLAEQSLGIGLGNPVPVERGLIGDN